MYGLSLGGTQQWARTSAAVTTPSCSSSASPQPARTAASISPQWAAGTAGACAGSTPAPATSSGITRPGRRTGCRLRGRPRRLGLLLSQPRLPRVGDPRRSVAVDILRRHDHRPPCGQPRRHVVVAGDRPDFGAPGLAAGWNALTGAPPGRRCPTRAAPSRSSRRGRLLAGQLDGIRGTAVCATGTSTVLVHTTGASTPPPPPHRRLRLLLLLLLLPASASASASASSASASTLLLLLRLRLRCTARPRG